MQPILLLEPPGAGETEYTPHATVATVFSGNRRVVNDLGVLEAEEGTQQFLVPRRAQIGFGITTDWLIQHLDDQYTVQGVAPAQNPMLMRVYARVAGVPREVA